MPLYFAYGINMDRDAMASRCPASRPLGLARLPRHLFVIMRSGYASVARDPRQDVWGLLWDLALADGPALDRFEGVGGGLYRKAFQPVLAAGGMRRAMIYLGRDAGPGTPQPGYLDGVLAAGAREGLPAAYLAAIGRAGTAGATPPPRIRPTRATPLDAPAPRQPSTWRWTP